MSDIGMLAIGFVTSLEKKHIYYKHRKLRGVYDQIIVTFTGNQIPEITINFIFDENNSEVQIRVIDIIPSINEKRMGYALTTVNDLNTVNAFGKFCITGDNNLEFRIDAMIDQECSSAFCFELMRKALKICDESYLRLAEL